MIHHTCNLWYLCFVHVASTLEECTSTLCSLLSKHTQDTSRFLPQHIKTSISSVIWYASRISQCKCHPTHVILKDSEIRKVYVDYAMASRLADDAEAWPRPWHWNWFVMASAIGERPVATHVRPGPSQRCAKKEIDSWYLLIFTKRLWNFLRFIVLVLWSFGVFILLGNSGEGWGFFDSLHFIMFL